MTEEQAEAFLTAVRRAGAELMKGLSALMQTSSDDIDKWKLATARAMGSLQDELLEPILDEHPQITPPELGGPASRRKVPTKSKKSKRRTGKRKHAR